MFWCKGVAVLRNEQEQWRCYRGTYFILDDIQIVYYIWLEEDLYAMKKYHFFDIEETIL